MPFAVEPEAFTWENLANAWADLDFAWTRGLIIDIGLGPESSFRTVSDSAFALTATRGKSRDLDRTPAGTLSVSFRNETRRFDPLNDTSDLDGYILPRKPVRVIVDGRPVFFGLIDNWVFDYEVGGESTASFNAFDAFSIFANRPNENITLAKQRSDQRVEALLDQTTVQWPSTLRDIAKGDTFLEQAELDGTVLSEFDEIDTGEAGLLFVDAFGVVTFRPRNFNQPDNPLTFTDNGTGLPYTKADIVFGLELFANRATVENSDSIQVFDNLVSQAEFGITERSLTTGLSNLVQLRGLAKYVVARYGEPEYRVEQIEVNLRALTGDQQLDVLDLDIGSVVEVQFTPNQVGDPLILRNRIIGLSHNLSVDTHIVLFSFENLPFGDFFVLDDADLGKLDNTDTGLGF